MSFREVLSFIEEIQTDPNFDKQQMIFLQFNYKTITPEQSLIMVEGLKKYNAIKCLKLLLFGSGLSIEHYSSILNSISGYKNLTEIDLNLGIGSLNSQSIESISKAISCSSKNIKSIEIQAQYSPFSSESLKLLSVAISNCSNIQSFKFHMSSCSEAQNGVLNFLDQVSKTSSLTEITFNFASIKLGDAIIPLMIKTLSNLKKLINIGFDLTETGISEVGINQYVDVLLKAKRIKEVMLIAKENQFDEVTVIRRLIGQQFELYQTAIDADDLIKENIQPAQPQNEPKSDCSIF